MSTDLLSADSAIATVDPKAIVFSVEATTRKYNRTVTALLGGERLLRRCFSKNSAFERGRFAKELCNKLLIGRKIRSELYRWMDEWLIEKWEVATEQAEQEITQRRAERAAKRASAPATIPIAPPQQQTEITVDGFTYGDLEQSSVSALEDHAAAIQQITETVRRSGAEAVLAVGKTLTEAHELLAGKGADGLFRPWIKERCGFGKSAAYRAMAAYAAFNKCPSVGRFDPTALYLLSNDLCPEDATQEAIDRATKGEQITAKTAREIKARHKGDGDRPEQLLCLEACKLIRAAVVRIGDRVHPDHAPAVVEFLRTLADQIEDGRQEIAGVCLTTRDGGAE